MSRKTPPDESNAIADRVYEQFLASANVAEKGGVLADEGCKFTTDAYACTEAKTGNEFKCHGVKPGMTFGCNNTEAGASFDCRISGGFRCKSVTTDDFECGPTNAFTCSPIFVCEGSFDDEDCEGTFTCAANEFSCGNNGAHYNN